MSNRVNKKEFDEISVHLQKDDEPSQYIKFLSHQEEYAHYPFTLLWKLKETEQSKTHHPEGSVWNHTMLVIDEAAKVRNRSKNVICFMWAALLHDIGKPTTTRVKKGRITSYDHDVEGERISRQFLMALTEDKELINQITSLVRYHMHMLYVLKSMPYGDVKNMVKKVDINEIALLCSCDRLGRIGAKADLEEENYKEFLSILKNMLREE